eukprot:13412-Heterococcus_DN1.PRE.1
MTGGVYSGNKLVVVVCTATVSSQRGSANGTNLQVAVYAQLGGAQHFEASMCDDHPQDALEPCKDWCCVEIRGLVSMGRFQRDNEANVYYSMCPLDA